MGRFWTVVLIIVIVVILVIVGSGIDTVQKSGTSFDPKKPTPGDCYSYEYTACDINAPGYQFMPCGEGFILTCQPTMGGLAGASWKKTAIGNTSQTQQNPQPTVPPSSSNCNDIIGRFDPFNCLFSSDGKGGQATQPAQQQGQQLPSQWPEQCKDPNTGAYMSSTVINGRNVRCINGIWQ